MSRFTTSDGISLHYDDSGIAASPGPAILCLAGLTRNATDFDYVAPHLSANRLIRLDYRGRGQSERAPWESYTIPVEARDSLELLDHLGLDKVAILGTSRGGLIAMALAATAKHRLAGVALNDIGPVIDSVGLNTIRGYIGRNPTARTHATATALIAARMTGFANVPEGRWAEEVKKHYVQTDERLTINYDPDLARAFEAASERPAPDLWPLFDALDGLPLALIRGANSDLLSRETAAEMRARRPDMIFAEVPDRGHVPFLDEPEALKALQQWIASL